MGSDPRATFLKVAGLIWGGAILAIVAVALSAPHMGRLADFVLYQTAYRDWLRLTLYVEQGFFDLSTPLSTIKSYYSALYRDDAVAMQKLTSGVLQGQMRLRMSASQPATGTSVYRSYLQVAIPEAQHAMVTEKFHLFWQRGLRFYLRQNGVLWRIDRVRLLP